MRYLNFFLLLFCLQISLCSQVQFENQTMIYNPDIELRSGVSGACADLNNDGLDDLVIIDKATHMYLGYNQGADTPMLWLTGPKVSSNREFVCLVTDLENDGIKEIITSGVYTNTKVYKPLPNGNYTFDQQIKESIFAQGANTVDIDNDGFLDYFLCHDDGSNLVAFNDGQGNLIKDLDFINWDTNPISDNSGNYASEWVDVNNDGLLDIAIAKCRIGVDDPEDPRRINRLMIQQSDGTFIDEAKERGFAIGYQSWTASMADFDNDGDFDCFVTNHDHEHQLLINDGNGYFFEKPYASTIAENFAFQSIVRDFDNNGFLDIYITGDQKSLMLLNDGGAWFDIIENPLDGYSSSALVGDINSDGLSDIVAMYPININFPGTKSDQIFINQTTNNFNYVDIQLKGNQSNLLGIGAQVTLHTQLGSQIQTVKSGESYGISSPFVLHFGLGSLESIDSITVDWPSGQYNVLKPYDINKRYLIEEGKCTETDIDLFDQLVYCGDSIQLNAPDEYIDYYWSTGDTTLTTFIGSPGIYQLAMTNDSGCIVNSTPIVIKEGRLTPPLIATDAIKGCQGDTIVLHSILTHDSYLWSTLDTTSSVSVSNDGTYFLNIQDECSNLVSDSIYIQLIDPLIISIENDTFKKGETATLIAKGDNIIWYESELDDSPIEFGDTLLINDLEESTSYFAENIIQSSQEVITSGIAQEDIGNYLHGENEHFSLFLSVYNTVVISKITLNAVKEGTRRLVVLNDALQLIDSYDIYCSEGLGTYNVNLTIPPGFLYTLGTDPLVNMNEFGTNSPQLMSNTDMISYPYDFGDMSIISSTGSRDLYPYFYDITIEKGRFSCMSDRVEVKAILDASLNSSDQSWVDFKVYPNPVNSILHFNFEDSQSRGIKLYTPNGNLLIDRFTGNTNYHLDISSLPSGIYFIEILSEEGQYYSKIVKD